MTTSKEKKESCEHKYKQEYGDFEKESYECEKCGDRYSLYYEDMQ